MQVCKVGYKEKVAFKFTIKEAQLPFGVGL